MPSRTTSEIVTIRENAYYSGINYGTTPGGRFTTGVKTNSASISWDGNGKKTYHACDASKTRYIGCAETDVSILQEEAWGAWSGNVQTGWKFRPELKPATSYWPTCRADKSLTFGYSDSELESRINSAAVKLNSLPIQSMMNLPQAIIELKDIPKLVRAVPRCAAFLLNAAKGRAGGLTAMSSIGSVARGYLAAQFGIAPTVQDVNNFLGQVPTRVRAGKRSVKYVKGQRVRAAFSIRGDGLSEYLDNGKMTDANGTYTRQVQTSQTLYRFDTPFQTSGANTTGVAADGVTSTKSWPYGSDRLLQSEEVSGVVFGTVANDFAADLSALDDINLNAGPLQTAWELLPFSFVVDWFCDVGKWMRDQNRLSQARLMGFSLNDGMWISQRFATRVYKPKPLQLFQVGMQVDDASSIVRFNWSTVKSVHWPLFSEMVSYKRHLWRSALRFSSIDTKGIFSQGAFQWSIASALAISACEAFRAQQ